MLESNILFDSDVFNDRNLQGKFLSSQSVNQNFKSKIFEVIEIFLMTQTGYYPKLLAQAKITKEQIVT